MSASLRTLLLSLVIGVALPACAESTAPEDTIIVTPSSTRLVRDALGSVTVSYRVSNPSMVPVYLETCGVQLAARLDLRASTTTWTSASYSGSACYSSFYGGPYRLDPGQSVTGSENGRFLAGEYRISIPVSRNATIDRSRTVSSVSISIM